jgi:hypothetical protein
MKKLCECGGTLQRYEGKDGGRLVTFPITDRGYALRGMGTEVRRTGAMLACNRCEHCEAA